MKKISFVQEGKKVAFIEKKDLQFALLASKPVVQPRMKEAAVMEILDANLKEYKTRQLAEFKENINSIHAVENQKALINIDTIFDAEQWNSAMESYKMPLRARTTRDILDSIAALMDGNNLCQHERDQFFQVLHLEIERRKSLIDMKENKKIIGYAIQHGLEAEFLQSLMENNGDIKAAASEWDL